MLAVEPSVLVRLHNRVLCRQDRRGSKPMTQSLQGWIASGIYILHFTPLYQPLGYSFFPKTGVKGGLKSKKDRAAPLQWSDPQPLFIISNKKFVFTIYQYYLFSDNSNC